MSVDTRSSTCCYVVPVALIACVDAHPGALHVECACPRAHPCIGVRNDTIGFRLIDWCHLRLNTACTLIAMSTSAASTGPHHRSCSPAISERMRPEVVTRYRCIAIADGADASSVAKASDWRSDGCLSALTLLLTAFPWADLCEAEILVR